MTAFARVLVAVLCGSWLCIAGLGCATGPAEEGTEESASSESSGGSTASRFGDDPMGVARRWTSELPASAPERFRERVSDWEEPVVARIYRRESGAYRAVVLSTDEGDAEGLLVAVEQGEDGWQVGGVEPVEGRHGWTSY